MAKKTPPGTKQYRLTQAYYSKGKLWTPGDIITVKDGDRVSRTWVLLDEDGDELAPPVTAESAGVPLPLETSPRVEVKAPTKSLRPSDRSIG